MIFTDPENGIRQKNFRDTELVVKGMTVRDSEEIRENSKSKSERPLMAKPGERSEQIRKEKQEKPKKPEKPERKNAGEVKAMENKSHARLRHFLVHLLGIGGTLLAIYVSGWVMFLEPLIGIYREYRAGTMTYGDILKVAISVAMAATAGGGIWCAFDILANFFRDRD